MGKEDKRHRAAHSARELWHNRQSIIDTARNALKAEPMVGGHEEPEYQPQRDLRTDQLTDVWLSDASRLAEVREDLAEAKASGNQEHSDSAGDFR